MPRVGDGCAWPPKFSMRIDHASATRRAADISWYWLSNSDQVLNAILSMAGRLGVIYQYGRGVPQNYAEALKWNRLAADQGNARARTNLGVMYHYGQGAPQNEAEAVKLYRLAANQGSTEAQTNLAIMYEQGQGVTKDSAEAMRLYRLAADQGYAPAQSGLGAMYADAQGDNVSAYMWFSLSAAQGYQNGARNLEAIAKRMSASQIAEAQKRASASDLAVILVSEFEAWFQSLASKGVLPRAFTGVTKNGNQVVVVLTGLPLDHVQRRDFLIWLCQTEQFVAYAYATRVGVAADSDSAITDSLDIYASSDRYDASKTLGIDELTDGTHKFIDQHQVVLQANPENGLFFGLQHSTHNISGDDQELFRKLWSDLKPKSMWQQR
jgi:TPR repeat protein